MVDVYGGPFGTYAVGTGVINAAGKNEMGAALVSFAALLGITLTAGNGVASTNSLTQSVVSPHPDFDKIAVEMRAKIGVELSAIANAMDAAAEA